jgi:hypothetical protein
MTLRISNILGDIGSVIEWPFVHVARGVSIVTTALKNYPAVRDAIGGLLQKIETVATDATAAASQDELNPVTDAAEVAAAVALYQYVKQTFLPALKAAYDAEVTAATGAQDIANKAAAARSEAARKAAATNGAQSTVTTVLVPAASGTVTS